MWHMRSASSATKAFWPTTWPRTRPHVTGSRRSAKYVIQISDATANRFSVVEANVTHDGTNAYISTFGGADNGTSDGSSVYDALDFTAVISSGDVRVRGKVNNTNSHVIKFIRRAIKV